MPTTQESRVPFEQELESYRRPLTGYCYRMLGAGSEAEDAVQEAMVRAWKSADKLHERAAMKSWLYRIASNVCFDILQSPQRRALPMDMGPAAGAGSELGVPLQDTAWVMPFASGSVQADDPAAITADRETLRLAFVAALQHLPARQRAVLVLCEVLRWKASEVAELLETSVASVNSALQRARATLERLDLDADVATLAESAGAGGVGGAGGVAGAGGVESWDQAAMVTEQAALLERYVDAFERYDIGELVTLLRDDATFSMPPFPLWLRGPEEAGRFMLGTGAKCEGSRLLTTSANGGPAVGIYNNTAPGVYDPWAIVVVEMADGLITGLHHFIYPELFPTFGLPDQLQD